MSANETFTLEVTGIDKVCKAGEIFGRQCQKEGKIPVFSCEGGCIKGEIARQTANNIAKADGYTIRTGKYKNGARDASNDYLATNFFFFTVGDERRLNSKIINAIKDEIKLLCDQPCHILSTEKLIVNRDCTVRVYLAYSFTQHRSFISTQGVSERGQLPINIGFGNKIHVE